MKKVEHPSASAWRDRFRAEMPGLCLEWLVDGPIEARMKQATVASASFSERAGPPLRVEREPCSDLGYVLVQHLRGSGRYHDRRQEMSLGSGDLILVDTARPFWIAYPEPVHLILWTLPRALLEPMLPRPKRARLCAARSRTSAGAVVNRYARALAQQVDELETDEEVPLLTHLCGLVALSARDDAPPERPRRSESRAIERQRILDYIEMHLCDPQLRPELAARELHMSRRRLYSLLAERGIRFSAWVTRRRLERCRKLLADPSYARLSVAEIAFSSGFNDLSTFYRRYRRSYGTTPRGA